MNNALLEPKITIKISNKIEKLIVASMYALSFLMYCFPNREKIIGLFLATSMILTVFTKYYTAAPIMCLMGNRSLLHMFFGKIQILYLALPLVLLRWMLLRKKSLKMSLHYFVFYLSILVMLGHLLVFDTEPLRTIIYTVLWLTAVLLIFNEFYETKQGMNPIFFQIGISIFISALQFTVFDLLGLTGGVLYHENVEGGLSRYGVFGASDGDPNYSGMYLLVGFFIILFYCKQIKWYLKIPMLACFILPVFHTASASTFLFLIITLLMYVIFVPSVSKKIKIIFSVVLAVLILFVLTYFFEIDFLKILELDEISRFVKKVGQAQEGNVSDATTGRTEWWIRYFDYFVNQPAIRILFGGNEVRAGGMMYVSHNTYIDFFIRFGLFGGLFLTGYIIYKVVHAFYVYIKTKKDTELCFLKLLVSMFIFTMSFFAGPIYVLSTIVLLFLKYDDSLPIEQSKELKATEE